MLAALRVHVQRNCTGEVKVLTATAFSKTSLAKVPVAAQSWIAALGAWQPDQKWEMVEQC
jgi:hypothetical protein